MKENKGSINVRECIYHTKIYYSLLLPFTRDYCDLGASLVAQTVKNLPSNAEDSDSILELGRSLGEGNGNPLQYSCLENSMDREAWRAAVHVFAKSRTQLSN